MSKKAQAFQIASEAIDLDSGGHSEAAFTKYVQCLQMLSTFLTEQLKLNQYSSMKGIQKKETKQVLSVICDCADRANSIFKLEVGDHNLPSISSSTQSMLGVPTADKFPHCGITINSKSIQDSNRSMLPSSNPQTSSFMKMEKENKLIFKKYRLRMDNAKDKYTRQNLELELQRRLSENLAITQAKQAQMQKEQQEERKAFLEAAIRTYTSGEPCSNGADQEKKELYVEVLKYEAKQNEISSVEDYSGLSSQEVVDAIFQRTLKCSNHPLTQWLIMVQMKLKNQLFQLLQDFSHYIPHLPGIVNDSFNDSNAKGDDFCHDPESLKNLQKNLEDVTQSVRQATDVIVEILYAIYKEQLSSEAETLACKLAESLLVIPLWCLLISLSRIANYESEWRISETMKYCRGNSQEFGSISESEVLKHCVHHIGRIISILSITDKLTLLVHISQSACYSGVSHDGSPRKLLGADALVAALSYILVQSGIPQFVSECRLLEMLVDPKYMLGEEGYSLSSFQTALCYLEMKKLIDPCQQKS